ncbi:MAG: hypothetical protein KC620_22295 [Myxococcales bacterium]|nr:hypothetical protein [Myxococcales bacterium]
MAACSGGGTTAAPVGPAALILAEQYAVEVEILTTDCQPGGVDPRAVAAEASVTQRGAQVIWSQRAAEATGSAWQLTGTLVASGDSDAGPPETATVCLAGQSRARTADGESFCSVSLELPDTETTASACDGAMIPLEMDACGVLRASFRARAVFFESCAEQPECTLVLKWTARPLRYADVAATDAGRLPSDGAECEADAG